MAVRSINGSTDVLNHTVGTSLSGMTFGTVAAIVTFASTSSAERTFFGLHNSAGTNRVQVYQQNTDLLWWNSAASNGGDVDPTIATSTWYLIVARKATGTGAIFFSVYNFTAETWFHASAGNTGNFTSAGASGTVRMSFGTSSVHNGLIAVRGAWADSLPWAASTAGGTALESAGLESTLQAWSDASPTSLWRYNQAAVTEAVDDLVGDAHQSSRTGTTVVTDDDPPNFSFSDAGQDITPAAVTVTAGAGSLTLTTSAAVTPAAVTVTAAAGTVSLTIGVAPTGPTVTATPGTVTITATAAIVPAAVTVTAAAATLSVSIGVSLAGASASVTPATLAVGEAGAVLPTTTAVAVTPAELSVTATATSVDAVTPASTSSATVTAATSSTPALAAAGTSTSTVTGG